ncbi:Carboxylesterase [Lipomyces japonicus]|uniref:Carboxylesterase n=1 Tax=Lipomyces japonicus TaxID=56871 RepID=UPI0034CD9E99
MLLIQAGFTLAVIAWQVMQAQAVPLFGRPDRVGGGGGENNNDGPAQMPVVDLGYAKYRATYYDEKNDFYMFKNIRYAAPPTGARRFQAPQDPLPQQSAGVLDGSEGWMCYQTGAHMFKIIDYISDPRAQSEDCLFLDVGVPGHLLRSNGTANHGGNNNGTLTDRFNLTRPISNSPVIDPISNDIISNPISNGTIPIGHGGGLPVLTWIHGGGFTFGSKDVPYNPAGLFKAAKGGMVYVAFNYRLGAFGWLAGSQVEKHGLTNAGLHDQRKALDWIHSHISKFGGNANDMTVLGESAGASSIVHHLTAPAPVQFARAIPQSIAYYPQYDKKVLETQYNVFANLAGCGDAGQDSFECLIKADVAKLSRANRVAVDRSLYGTFQFGPYVDNKYVPELPLFRLKSGDYSRGVKILAGFNSNEGALFSDPRIFTEKQVNRLVDDHFPNASEETRKEVLKLYPKSDYSSQSARVSNVISDWIVGCNHVYMANAFPSSYAYKVSIQPGLHSIDLVLTFFGAMPNLSTRPPSSSAAFLDGASSVDNVAIAFQNYLVNFAMHGDPNYAAYNGSLFDAQPIPVIGGGGQILEIGLRSSAVTSMKDAGSSAEKCDWWMKGDWTGN